MELSRIVLEQVIIIILLMAIGFTAKKVKIIGDEGVKQFTSFLLCFVTPCVLIQAYQKPFDLESAKLLLISFLMAVLVHIIYIIIATAIFRTKENLDCRVNLFACVYSNCGFMAIPLLSAALGSEGVFFGSAYLAVFSILQWTHGIYVCTKDLGVLSFKKAFLNPGVIGTLISIILFVFNITLPNIIGQTVGFVANLNTPLSMIILGTFLVGINPLKIIKNKAFYIVTVVKLIIAPLITIYFLKLLGINSEIIKALTISAACPVAGVTTLWAARFNLNAQYASQLVSITTVLSIITIPAVVMLV